MGWLQLLIFAIGAFNVLFTVPGTYWIRIAGVAASFAGLLVPGRPRCRGSPVLARLAARVSCGVGAGQIEGG